MTQPQNKRGPVARTTGPSENALPAPVESAYFTDGPISKSNDLASVPRVWLEIATQLLIDSLENSDRRELPEDSL